MTTVWGDIPDPGFLDLHEIKHARELREVEVELDLGERIPCNGAVFSWLGVGSRQSTFYLEHSSYIQLEKPISIRLSIDSLALGVISLQIQTSSTISRSIFSLV